MRSIESRARWMGRAAGLVFFMLLSITTLQAIAVFRMGNESWWAMLLPMPFYLYATGATWWSLKMLGIGQGLAPTLSRLMRRSGIALFIGGLVEVLGVNSYLAAFGAPGQPVNMTAIVIGVIGVGLVGLASLIDEGRAARAELDEFV